MSSSITLLAQSATSNPVTVVESAVGVRLNDGLYLAETYGIPLLKAVVLFIIGLLIARWIGRLIRGACHRAKFDITLGYFLSSLAHWLVLAAVVTMCLASFGVQVTSLVALLGTIGVAIGLALQGSLNHIASGVMLLIFRPFKVGDFVTAGGQTGTVHEISLFSTLLTTLDNRLIIVPNGAIVGGVITNATHYDQRVIDVNIQGDAGGNLESQRNALLAAARSVPGRIEDKEPGVALTAATPNSVWNVSIWCKTSEIDATKERLIIAAATAIANHAPPAPVTLVKNV